MKRKLLSLILITLILSSCGGKATWRQISQAEAMEIIKNESEYVILDVRTPEEFSEKHIKDAVNLPLDEILNGNVDMLSDKKQMILVYCRSGNRSKTASAKLAELGYSNVLEFGGINTWQGEVE